MKKIIKILTVTVVCFSVLAFFTIKKTEFSKYKPVNTGHSFAPITFSSTVPTDPKGGYNSSPEEMAEFAWQEFIAVNWPAATNSNPASSGYKRGTPSTATLGATGAGGTVVWETFAHRVELYPGPQGPLPAIEDAPINYQYPSFVTITPGPGATKTLFNNLDEASEITLADMYYTPMISPNTTDASLLYEAKANNVIYDYVKDNSFQNQTTRNNAAGNTMKKINNQTYGSPLFELPNGSVEMKATWRRYDPTADNLDEFHHTKAIWYSGKSPTFQVHNDIFLLIGLHVIQKTPEFQTFTYATFEHVSNEKNGFRFVNTHAEVDSTTIPGRSIPEGGVIKAIRQYPIPDGTDGSFNLVAYNSQVQNQLKTQFGNDIVWANYQLIGIQGQVTNNPTAEVPPQTFFLSNFVTETNNTLQFFQGTLTGTFANIVDPNTPKVHKLVESGGTSKFEAFTAGGCLGCHGSQGQTGGYDFSVISAKGNFFIPEAPEDYPSGVKVVNQNSQGFPLKQN
ncbi:hypothetical protein [Flavivirga jejuensis]|uniref:Cytochrome c domain-containing protein n=1 Tax=Flavivirga jejuensis TaxID=870487 RepID=A0ABT8WMK3_9FLAO|nr:hypothetical protein [Flavivirga jejuensis]MDO5974376.1 hypothetical protein [Flavivirga jejuensis]